MEWALCYYQKSVLCSGAEKMVSLENGFSAMAREIAFEGMI